MVLATVSIFSLSDASSVYSMWKLFFSLHASSTAFANSIAPAPPSAKCVHSATRAPAEIAILRIASCSEAWSVGNELMATTGTTPWAFTFSIWARRFSPPISTSAGFSASKSAGSALPATILYLPECAFNARTVVTNTAASGLMPE